MSKLTSYGMQSKLYYTFLRTMIFGTNPLFVPRADFYDGRLTLEMTQSLWRNIWGNETEAAIEATEAAALSQSFAEAYRALGVEAEAEAAYWRLALARDALTVQQQSVERALKIRDWNKRRVSLRLADDSDLFQAEAALELRQLELQSVQNEERAASLYLNSLRGKNENTVSENLMNLAQVDVSQIKLPPKAERRLDVESAYQAARASLANSRLAIEKNKPNFELYGLLALNGRMDTVINTIGDSLNTNKPTAAIGARFAIPLDFGLMSANREGYAQEARGNQLKYERRLFEQDKEWNDLSEKYAEAKKRLDLALVIEGVQRKKFLHEKERQGVGRSTTYLVLQFEQDLASSEFSRLKLQAEILTLIAQMKTFGGGV